MLWSGYPAAVAGFPGCAKQVAGFPRNAQEDDVSHLCPCGARRGRVKVKVTPRWGWGGVEALGLGERAQKGLERRRGIGWAGVGPTWSGVHPCDGKRAN